MTGTVYSGVTSPCYLLEEKRLKANLELIDSVQKRSGCEVILALKGFAMWSAFPVIKNYLKGCSASSYNEARLAREHFGGHVHLYSPAYREDEFDSLVELSDRISFNSLSQWQHLSGKALQSGVSCGLRVNPLIDEVETALYNPSGRQSRLGVAPEELSELPEGVEGLHVHALCENSAVSTKRLIEAVESRFGKFLHAIKWLNLGGGHLMTRAGYDVELLVNTLSALKQKYPHLEIVLEPGSAIAWDTGPLVAGVLDVVHRGGIDIAILDISATAHMPDVLEMPYRPSVRYADAPGAKAYTYRLGGMSCLAGDIVGDYSFDQPLVTGDQVVFEDMMHYTMVKTTMFNGVQHPSIAIMKEDGNVEMVRRFGYQDYEKRLS
jgi:carboxynorspermidine decarboxylase